MGDKTGIEWTRDEAGNAGATWNVITGCSVASRGCDACYAMREASGRLKNARAYAGLTNRHRKWNGQVRFNEHLLDQPLRWRKPRRIFVNSMGDLFHENVPDEWIDRVFAVMALAPQHQFQCLTKRADRMREYMNSEPWDRINAEAGTLRHWDDMATLDVPPRHIWLGVSVEDQERADERIPHLLDTPAAVRFVSAEPLLGPVDFTRLRPRGCTWLDALEGREHIGPSVARTDAHLDWLICGGESGPKARPMNPQWARNIRDQCVAAGVLFFFKQWGEYAPLDGEPNPAYPLVGFGEAAGPPAVMQRVGKKRAGRLLDGREYNGMPA